MMRVSVFGLGYVGCVTAASLARSGHFVVGVDVNEEKVGLVNAGRSPLVEPGLEQRVGEAVAGRRLRATTDLEDAVRHSDLALVCVGTPSARNGQVDVEAVTRVVRSIGFALRRRLDPFAVVVRSTLPPGTTEDVLLPNLLAGCGLGSEARIRIAVNPEFMREGTALADFARPPFTVVGALDPQAAELLRSLYGEVEAPFVHTSIRAAEMVKYVANAFHALKVAFANEIGDLSVALGVEPQEVMRIATLDRKLTISEAYLKPGFAFGGSCLPKDLRALVHLAGRNDVPVPLLASVLPSNEAQLRRGLEAVLAAGRRRVGVVGLAFKEGTDDLRESPLVGLVEGLIGKGLELRVLDRGVALARLTGANRRYIEEQIPHIASLMCGGAEQLVAHAETVVIGKNGPDSAEVLARVRPHQVVIDLTRGEARRATAAAA